MAKAILAPLGLWDLRPRKPCTHVEAIEPTATESPIAMANLRVIPWEMRLHAPILKHAPLPCQPLWSR